VKAKLEEARLYGICDLGYLALEDALSSSRELLEGGVGVLQLRAKEHDPNDLLDLAKGLRDLCEEFEIPFVVNDHLQLAPTKLGRPGIGLDDIKKMEATVGCEIPAFCIGGIIPDRLEGIRSAGARRVVVVSHLLH